MTNFITKLFGKTKKEEQAENTFIEKIKSHRKLPTINVNTDVAFHKPVARKLEEIKSKLDLPDYSKLTFEEEIMDFNLKNLTPDAKSRIIEIIKEDERTRIPSRMVTNTAPGTLDFNTFNLNEEKQKEAIREKIRKETEGNTIQEDIDYLEKNLKIGLKTPKPFLKMDNVSDPFKEAILKHGTIFGINPETHEIGDLSKDDKLITFEEYSKKELKQLNESLIKNRYNILYQTISNLNPDLSDSEISMLTKKYMDENI